MDEPKIRVRMKKPKDWIGIIILFVIPIISLISTGYFAFSKKDKERQNWAKAAFVISIIVHIIVLIMFLRLRAMSYQQLYNFISKLAGK